VPLLGSGDGGSSPSIPTTVQLLNMSNILDLKLLESHYLDNLNTTKCYTGITNLVIEPNI
jgi:hypothetical protein